MKNYLDSKSVVIFLLSAILFVGAILRLYGLNWDQNNHLHPDERFLTMVTMAIDWPSSLTNYLDPVKSTLNPYNTNFNFFVYGTFPLLIVKFFSQIIIFDNFEYHNITLVGRFISALLEVGIIFFIYKIGKLFFNFRVGILASLLYALAVLPIQLAHFFASDTFAVFFLVLTFYFFCLTFFTNHKEKFKNLTISLAGISLGLALACKLSSTLFFIILGLGLFIHLTKKRNWQSTFVQTFLLFFFAYLFMRIGDPKTFLNGNLWDPRLNPQFLANLKELQSFNNPATLFPPSIQWLGTQPYFFPLNNIFFWGLGVPLSLLSVAGIIFSVFFVLKKFMQALESRKRKLKPVFNSQETIGTLLLSCWVLFVFFYQGHQFIKPMRYFYPLYPFLIILTAHFLDKSIIFLRNKISFRVLLFTFYFLLFVSLAIWPLSFMAIYARPHSRIMASEWIYNHIPTGSILSCEHWDDCLPLSYKNKTASRYKTETLTLYDSDTANKWAKINPQLDKIDYLILSSNRLYGSIPKLPKKYPVTVRFYQDLFEGKTAFKKVGEFTSYPTLPIINLPIPDQTSDESFTVYDHPKVIIFKNEGKNKNN